jgi:hypothetical protein
MEGLIKTTKSIRITDIPAEIRTFQILVKSVTATPARSVKYHVSRSYTGECLVGYREYSTYGVSLLGRIIGTNKKINL